MTHQVAVLAGGPSLERDVSLRSGHRIANALSDRGHRVTLLDLNDRLVTTLSEGSFDVAYLALHGRAGEDGTIQGLLDLLGVPFTGPDAVASALAWDKAIFKGVVRRKGLPVPEGIAVSAEAVRDMGAAHALDRIVARLDLPLVVKPAQGGGSMGVRFVATPDELAPALVATLSYHDVAVVERFVTGTELAVTVLDGAPLPPVEIVPAPGGTYDFAARYMSGAAEFYAPARLEEAVQERCAAIAVAAYDLIGCRHVTRADMVVDGQGQPWLLELDTCPGMTQTSLVPMAAQAAGWDFAAFCERVLDLAVAPDGSQRASPGRSGSLPSQLWT